MLFITQITYDDQSNQIYDYDKLGHNETEFDNEHDLLEYCKKFYGELVGYVKPKSYVNPVGWKFKQKVFNRENGDYNIVNHIAVYEPCEHGHKYEIIQDDGRKRIMTGLRLYLLKNIDPSL